MTDLRTLLVPLDREAARTGVGYGLPEWLVYHEGEDGGFWTADTGDYAIDEADQDGEEWKAALPMDDRMQEVSSILPDDAARMIAEAGIARMLAERGIAVFRMGTLWMQVAPQVLTNRTTWQNTMLDTPDFFSALIAAALKVYATIPTPATAAREEGER